MTVSELVVALGLAPGPGVVAPNVLPRRVDRHQQRRPANVLPRPRHQEVIADLVPETPIRDLDATDPLVGERLRFPGSPTIRVDGRDINPSYVDLGD